MKTNLRRLVLYMRRKMRRTERIQISDKKFMGNSTVYIAGTLVHVAYASAHCEFHYFGNVIN